MATEYVIYADESSEVGPHFSNFYGGVLIRSTDLTPLTEALAAKKAELNFHGEVKWQKVTKGYLEKYVALVDLFFDLVAEDKVKVRLMFTQNRHVPTQLERYHADNRYHILYYHFIKHAFGLRYSHDGLTPRIVRIYLDHMPDTRENNARFKSFLVALSAWPQFRDAGVVIRADQIAEVRSHDHVPMQLLDIVLGAMQFRLNDYHKAKQPNTGRRGSRTRAKEHLYKHILGRVRGIYPNFNVGITTGKQGALEKLWLHPYRHWLFVPRGAEIDPTKGKRK